MAKAVFCIVNASQAASVVDRLKAAAFSDSDISVLMPKRSDTKDFAVDNSTKAPEGSTGAGTGMLLGGGLGWLAGMGALAIPGLGPLIAAGPIMAALTGAAVGGTVGGLTGGRSVGMGIPEYEAKRYEGKVKGGNALISVHSENSAETERAKTLFEAAGGQDVSTSSEAVARSSAHKRLLV